MVRPSFERWRVGKAYVRVRAAKYRKAGASDDEAAKRAAEAAYRRIPSGVQTCCGGVGLLLRMVTISTVGAIAIVAMGEIVRESGLGAGFLWEESGFSDGALTMLLVSAGSWMVAHIVTDDVPYLYFMSESEADRVPARRRGAERERAEGLDADRKLIAEFEKEKRGIHD